MNSELNTLLLNRIGKELNNKGFCLVDSTDKHAVFHKRNENYIEIIQWAQDKYETYITVSSSIAFLKVSDELSNINHKWFNEFNNGDFNKINVDDCRKKIFLKGHYGDEFHYGDVYIAFGTGRVGVSPNSKKKPIGFRIKKFKTTTYDEICDLVIKRINNIYNWLEKEKKIMK